MENTIRGIIEVFVAASPANRFPESEAPFFAAPLVGFASSSDPLFDTYKDIIGEFHQTPEEVFAAAYGREKRAATVICWVLPISRTTRESNRQEKRFPSREWAVTRDRGEVCNTALRRHVVEWLLARGHRAVAPQLAVGWRQLVDPEIGIASNWSERHTAYAAGLGSFSLNDGLITERGIAHRIGSVITDLSLLPTPRLPGDHRQHCLWYREQTCGLCIARCPVGAITFDGHDKEKCRDYVYGAVPEAVGGLYGVAQAGCGLCQTRVPCEAMVPPRKNGPLREAER